MKTLLIIVCCILFMNWALDAQWIYSIPSSIAAIVGSIISIFVSLITTFAHMLGMVVALGILIYIGCTFGVVGFVGAALLIAFTITLSSIVSLFWPLLIIAAVIVLCSSKKKRHYG
jgi:hypothetical protein